jgi:hypothetical protein
MLNQTLIVQFHRFYEIHLLAVRFLTGIFPNQLLSVREIAPPIILANTGFALADFPQEWSHLLMSLEHTPSGSRQSSLSTGRPAVPSNPDVSHPLEYALQRMGSVLLLKPSRQPLLQLFLRLARRSPSTEHSASSGITLIQPRRSVCCHPRTDDFSPGQTHKPRLAWLQTAAHSAPCFLDDRVPNPAGSRIEPPIHLRARPAAHRE